MVRVCVVGAGINGMATALQIQNRLPKCDLTVLSNSFSPNTTSDCAAGIWAPILLPDKREELIRKWGHDTLDYLRGLYNRPDHKDLGISIANGYFVYSKKTGGDDDDVKFGDMYITHSKLNSRVKDQMFPDYEEVYNLTTFIAEPYKLLPFLMNQFQENGGKFVQYTVKKLEELYDQYDVIVNATGVYASQLLNDHQMEPVRGQVYRVEAPWVKQFILVYHEAHYVIPGVDSVVVGGTHQTNDWNTNVCPVDSKEIMEQAKKLVPGIENARVLKEVVGLRPCRSTIRLESEQVQYHNKVIPIIHNYGQGGSGITLFWGCAKDAGKLVVESIQKLSLNSKL